MPEGNKKIKIAIVIDSYVRGGVALALKTFLQFLAQQSCEITLFVKDFEPTQMLPVPEGVVCCPWEAEQSSDIHHRLCALLNWRNFGRKSVYQARCRKMFPGEYDCVIGYQMITNTVTVVTLEKIQAKRKILWLHGKKNFREKDLPFYDALYSKADKIVCVSSETEERFRRLMPKCAQKTVTIHNFYDIPHILRQSEAPAEGMTLEPRSMTIVSVGRLSKEKGFDRVPAVAQKLVETGYSFHWYVVGDGEKRAELEAEIEKEGLASCVHLLGYRKNPYPYVRHCDIYVQPSYTEGFCTSTMEAKILHKPVVTTDVPGMREQFVDGENGLIVESSVDGIYTGIRKLLDDSNLMEKIKENLRSESVSNMEALRQTMEVINGKQA